MRIVAVSCAAIAGLVATAALAADASQPNPPKKNGFDPNQIVCKTVGVTGSHLGGQRVCLTWAEWEAQSQMAQRTVGDIDTQRGSPGGQSMGASNLGNSGGRMR